MRSELWAKANRALVAKAIRELDYEGLIEPRELAYGTFALQLAGGASYSFRGCRGIWGEVRLESETLRRGQDEVTSASRFFLDARSETAMSDIVLANYLEEISSTLAADIRLLERNAGLTANDLAGLSSLELQARLEGHPKLIANKGRLGWSPCDADRFAPESSPKFQLHWLAVKKTIAHWAPGSLENPALQSLDENAYASLASLTELEGFDLIPVHPWQWERILQRQFGHEIARGEIVPLGPAGDFYTPQISLRTLTNVSRPGFADVKLPLSILNTSAVRGIPSRYALASVETSREIDRIAREDELLAGRGCRILRDLAGVTVAPSSHSGIDKAPYRYLEALGAIWRESSEGADGETVQLTATLFHRDELGSSLLASFVERSGLSTGEWLSAYFEHVVVPLYHLQARYGLGVVAHGQNVLFRMRNFRPAGVVLKDFQGDWRASTEATVAVASQLDRLPPEHLIHDLVTGHFVTVLRFVSSSLSDSVGFPEKDFYAILRRSLSNYIREYGPVPAAIDLLSPTFERVLLNRVRFEIGYADSAVRPKPQLGRLVANPMNEVPR